jgi:hypothetical protein
LNLNGLSQPCISGIAETSGQERCRQSWQHSAFIDGDSIDEVIQSVDIPRMFVKKDDKKTRILAAVKDNAVAFPHYKSPPHHQGNSGGKNDSMLRRKNLGFA